jgi:hypothetical protein
MAFVCVPRDHRIAARRAALIAGAVLAGTLASCTARPQMHPELPPTATAEVSPTEPVPRAAPSVPELSFVPAIYRDEANGFELDYPSGWSVNPDTRVGSRGSQAQLLSPGASAENLPDGTSRVGITVYLWDPKNDLAAYADHRKSAWESGTQTVESEQDGNLAGGGREVDFVVRAADGARAFFLLTTLGDRYLEISGEGDLVLTQQIAHTLRLLDRQP